MSFHTHRLALAWPPFPDGPRSQPITHTPAVDNTIREEALQLLAQAPDIKLKAVPAHPLVTPDPGHELGVPDQPAFVEPEAGEKAELDGGEAAATSPFSGASQEIAFRGSSSRRALRPLSAAQQRAHPGHQLHKIRRCGHVSISPCFKQADPVAAFLAVAEDDDGKVRCLRQPGAQLLHVYPWRLLYQNHQVRAAFIHAAQPLMIVGHTCDLKPRCLQSGDDVRPHCLICIDQENRPRFDGSPPQRE